MLIVKCTIAHKEYALVNVYMHPSDNMNSVCDTFGDVLQDLGEIDVVMGGDFNAVINPVTDCTHPPHHTVLLIIQEYLIFSFHHSMLLIHGQP